MKFLYCLEQTKKHLKICKQCNKVFSQPKDKKYQKKYCSYKCFNTVYCSLNLITSYNLNRAGSPDANYYNLAESEKFKTKTRTLADVVQFFYNLVGNSVGNFY